ncbi:MAG: minor capsid protein [Fusicatenibacter sp.]|nr:minor capsid protein [Lachnospiraceae bacterium]MDY2936999.1 minor capsid protein [Fusicatenibacter sp.]
MKQLYLEDIQLLVKGMVLAEHVYIGKLDAKEQKSIGIYPFKDGSRYEHGVGRELTYGSKKVSFLVHWNKSPSDTEKAAIALFENLVQVKEERINEKDILFVRPLTDEPVGVGTDESGIYEMVIEAEFVYER